MKMIKKVLSLTLIAAMLLGMLSGCGVSETDFLQEGCATVIIVGNHANANKFTEKEMEALLGDKIERSFTHSKKGNDYCIQANVSIIVVDGKPEQSYVTFDGERIEMDASAKSIEKVLHEKEYICDDINAYLFSDDLRANDAEVDLLAAIAEAETILDSYPDSMEKHMVIYDTGITTAGFLNMNKIDIQNGSVDQVLERLPEGAFHKLGGIKVTFGGLGNVCFPQSDMRQDSSFKNRLENLWTAYFTRCGAELTAPIEYAAKGNDPMVNVVTEGEAAGCVQPNEEIVSYEPVSIVSFKLSEKEVIEEFVTGSSETPIILSTVELGFKGDSAEFRDQAAAEKALISYEEIFTLLKEHPEITIYVVGSKAKTTPDEDVSTDPLSRDRANAVANLIQKMFGISASQIQIIDAGTTRFSWRSGVEFPDGTWASKDKVAQMQNRVVAIIPSTSSSLVNELSTAGKIG